MVRVLERGDLYFFYRPRGQEAHPAGREDIQRVYLILSPDDGDRHRLIIIGHKKLPEIERGRTSGEERVWGFVSAVAERPEQLRDELAEPADGGKRQLPRPAGEGRYALVEHGDHVHLAYALELPEKLGPVQAELQIKAEASYVVSVKNPDQPSPLDLNEEPSYPKRLRDLFGRRKFITAAPPELLDYENVEVLLIGAQEDAERELGIQLDPEQESAATAELFRELKLDRERSPVKPLFEGEWQ